jgi:hypothetical protein
MPQRRPTCEGKFNARPYLPHRSVRAPQRQNVYLARRGRNLSYHSQTAVDVQLPEYRIRNDELGQARVSGEDNLEPIEWGIIPLIDDLRSR